MKKALIVDWLDKYGGAERVIASLEKTFSFDITYLLANTMSKVDLLKIYPTGKEIIKVSPLQKFKGQFRLLFFTFHYFISRIKVDIDVELVISSSHAVAKGIKKSSPKQLHISYFQARNFNYIWSDYTLYFGPLRFFIFPIVYFLRKIDIRQSKRPDYIISNSLFVKKWVKEKYGRESDVIYPPVDLSKFSLERNKEDYYIIVGRLVQVKRFDLAIQAFNISKKKLIVVGDGAISKKLKRMAHENIIFTGFLDSERVGNYVKNAKAFIQTGVEGFGIAPIESQACGTPVIAFAEGGVLETVISHETGVFFKEQTVESLASAIELFETIKFDPSKIREHALLYSQERFEKEIAQYVQEKWAIHNSKLKAYLGK